MAVKEFDFYSGEIIRKCPLEHFNDRQFLYGSPYSYISKYADFAGGTPEKRYVLWRFNVELDKYEVYQTADEKSYNTLSDIAEKWEKAMWAEKFKNEESGI
jgi:hypothetical protein